MKKIGLVLLPVLLLSSCLLFQSRSSPYPEGVVFPVQKTKEILYEGEILNRILKKNQRLYFATRKGLIYCFDGRNYETLWRVRMQELPASPVYMGESRFFIFDINNNVSCFDLEGKTLWQVALQEEISSPLVEINGILFLGTAQGSFIAVDVTSGEEKWHFSAGDAIHSNAVVFEEKAKGVAYGLVTAVVCAAFHKLFKELHVPLG